MIPTAGAIETDLVVLLAEDKTPEKSLIWRAFKRLGVDHRLMLVPDGEQTVSYLLGDGKFRDRKTYPFPEIVFLDYQMPILSGLGVLCWLRNEPRFEHLPVVVLSDACSVAQIDTIGHLRAACCMKTNTPTAVMGAIAQSVRRALDTPCGVLRSYGRDAGEMDGLFQPLDAAAKGWGTAVNP